MWEQFIQVVSVSEKQSSVPQEFVIAGIVELKWLAWILLAIAQDEGTSHINVQQAIGLLVWKKLAGQGHVLFEVVEIETREADIICLERVKSEVWL